MRKPGSLKRERLSRELEGVFAYPLTIVEAPMGYGKTTAVKQFLSSQRGPVLWVSFLSAENATSFFWERFSDRIGVLDEATGHSLRSLGFPMDAPQMANVLSQLNAVDFERETVLVVDDFHIAQDPRIGALISLIAKEAPPNLHVVILTRDTTNLNLGELAARGLCLILTQHLLRFSLEEIRQYCQLMGRAVSEEALLRIREYTGGCISLVYLVLLGLDRGIPIGMNTTIYELVEKNLYNAYGKRIREFLLDLSVVDEFTLQQAMFVSGESKAEEYLKKLRRENAFISFDEATGEYRIHNVLLDFLRMKPRDEGLVNGLCRRAGEWYLQQRRHNLAYSYLWRAGELELILSLLDETVTNDYAEFDGWQTMFRAAPRELLHRYPIAYLQYIGLLLLSGDPRLACEGGERLSQLRLHYETSDWISSEYRDRILGEICAVSVFTAFNDAEKMITYTEEALRLLKGDNCRMILKHSEFTFGCPHFVYSYYKVPGQLKQTVDTMVAGFPAFPRLANGCGTGCEYLTLAEYAAETGDFGDAETNARKAIYKARTEGQTGVIICATLALIRTCLCLGRLAEGLSLLGQLRQEVSEQNNGIYNTTVDLCEGYVYACLRLPDRIPKWLRSGDTSLGRFLLNGLAFSDIVLGKTLVILGDFVRLEVLVETFRKDFAAFHSQTGFLYCAIFDAVAKRKLYGIEAGLPAMTEALDLGRRDRVLMPFAESAPDILDMLQAMPGADQYVKDVFSLCVSYSENLRQAPGEAAPLLSVREREVLALAAEGLKREEIAGRLYISTGTVRTHMQNIYQKLEVSGKTAAINKATKMMLL